MICSRYCSVGHGDLVIGTVLCGIKLKPGIR